EQQCTDSSSRLIKHIDSPQRSARPGIQELLVGPALPGLASGGVKNLGQLIKSIVDKISKVAFGVKDGKTVTALIPAQAGGVAQGVGQSDGFCECFDLTVSTGRVAGCAILSRRVFQGVGGLGDSLLGEALGFSRCRQGDGGDIALSGVGQSQ